MSPKRILGFAIVASALASSAALAATGMPESVRGSIASATGDPMTAGTYADKSVTVALTGDTTYLKVEQSNQRKYAPRVSKYTPQGRERGVPSHDPAISPGWPEWFSQ